MHYTGVLFISQKYCIDTLYNLSVTLRLLKNAKSPVYIDKSCHSVVQTITHTHRPSLLFQHPYNPPFLSFHHIILPSFLIILTSSFPTHSYPHSPHRLVSNLPANDQEVYRLLKLHMSNKVAGSAYNWVRPSLWSALFSSKDRDKEK